MAEGQSNQRQRLTSAERRQARLAAELRANLIKRKARSRAKAEESDGPGTRPEEAQTGEPSTS